MTGAFFIKPAPGAKVRDPVTKEHLSDDGEQKPRSSYWLRRISDGVVVVIKPATEEAKTVTKIASK